MPTSRRRAIDIAAVAIFLTIIAVLFWPSGDDGENADSAPDDVSETEMTPTPEASVTAEATPVETPATACEPGESAQVMARFVTHFNDGNVEALDDLLPQQASEESSTAVFPAMDRGRLHLFRVHESGAMSNPDDALAYLESRHEADETWRLRDYSVVRLADYAGPDSPELDRAEAVIERSAENLPPHELEGRAIIDCRQGTILSWEFSTDNIEMALPISVEEFLGAVGPYGTAEMRDLRMLVSTDLREDGGTLGEWEAWRIDANNAAGHYVQAVEVFTTSGEQLIDFVYDSSRWYLEQRGWQESGSITGRDVLPLEMMFTRNEPSETAALIRDNLDDIPDNGSYQITGEFDVYDELQRAAARVAGMQAPEGIIEVDLHDGNVVRTRYRLVDRQSGASLNVPEIQWIHIQRREAFEPGHFVRPDGFRPDDRQFQAPDELESRLTFEGTIEHDTGVGEQYQLEWNGEIVSLTVLPSRGGSDENTFPADWPLTWETRQSALGDNTLVSGGPAESSAFPHAAVWDTGEYRFELAVDADALSDPAAWGTGVVNEIATALSGTGD